MELRSPDQPTNSMLDSDLYKFSMQNAILELYPDAQAEYIFVNRNESYKFDLIFLNCLQDAINNMEILKLTQDEKNFLKDRCPFLKPSYLEYLDNYHFNPKEVKISLTDKGQLQIAIKGSWHSTVLWEVPLMATISELYFRRFDLVSKASPEQPISAWSLEGQREKATKKGNELWKNGCLVSEFGTRRRRSFETQLTVVDALRTFPTFVGTSNVYLAYKYGLRPIGTVAHEFIMAQAALNGLRHSNRFAMDDWSHVYKASLGTALTDTYGVDAFLGDFTLYHSKLWDGVRQDSGDPFMFVDKMVEHYMKFKIDPMTKTIIFSDALNVEKCIKLNEYCKGRIRCSFGVGTHFTNDFADGKAMNMVIKLKSINGIPVVKLSEDDTKAIGDRDALRVARWMFLGKNLDYDRED